ncbi:hypothetical protein EJ06DRAFT_37998 [Trichodelitschia bisporula]|uniref:SEC7 domain-containing protein n=1 Tax=Trichodelitschia bisporula TaxID=703511 RepID=A0A6G1HVI2_9PEZI|nr:hypothetical protein EJ06DRAFT_37998 [Trichodelitschia bisporula]
MELVDRPAGERDSHDLSLRFTRFSVVDSMLLSLSDFPSTSNSTSPFNDFDATTEIYTTSPHKAPSNSGRRRGHTATSSLSDYDLHVDDTASRYAVYHSRGRGNVSQSKRPTRTESTASNSTRPDHDGPRHSRGTGIKGSKGSGSSSMDLGYTAGNGFVSSSASAAAAAGRHAHGPSRAASFDQSCFSERVQRPSPHKKASVPMLDRNLSEPSMDYDDDDAAPTPTIPAGPRRPTESLSPAILPSPVTPRKAPSRKNSMRSTTGGRTLRKPKSQTQAGAMDPAIRDQAKQFVQQTNNMLSVHASSTPSAPSPTVSSRKVYPAVPVLQPAPKERPGFFRRVFGGGSSKNSSPAPQPQDDKHDPSPPLRQTSSNVTPSRPRTQPAQQHMAQTKPSSSRPPTQDPSSSRDIGYTGTLKKSHSSFFRRRKKSLTETMPPPVPVLQPFQQQKYSRMNGITPAQPSPTTSSLRNVMAPYLADKVTSPRSPLETYFDSQEHQPPMHDFDRGRDVSPHNTTGSEAPTRPAPTGPPFLDEFENRTPRHGTTKLRVQSVQVDRSPFSLAANINQRNRPSSGFVGDMDGGSFLADNSGDDQPFSTHRSPPPTSSPYSATTVRLDEPAPRRANIGEKRIDYLSSVRLPGDDQPSRLLDDDDDDQYMTSAVTTQGDSSRLWLDGNSSDEKLPASARLSLPLEGPRTSDRLSDQLSPSSENDVFSSATSLPVVHVENRELVPEWADTDGSKAILAQDTEITADDRDRAQKIFDGDESFVPKSGAAAWLGQTNATSLRVRRAYMDLFDWAGVNILAAFRELCCRLVVKAESQQLDRVIDAFSERWCHCNPSHGFKDRDVVHTITYSVLMLNTDLHIADIEQRMTRNQFVKNTLPTIRSIADAALPTQAEMVRAQSRHSRGNWEANSPSSPVFAADEPAERHSLETRRSRNRLSIRPPARADSEGPGSSSDNQTIDNCNVLVKAPYEGGMKGWEFQVEIVLKEFYNSIRTQCLPLHGSNPPPEASSGGLSVVTNALRRTPSVLSKAPSDTVSYRGRSTDFRTATARFGSKPRSRPRVYPSSTIGSSRTSLDDQSVWSPAGSTWSKYSLGKTPTSMSVDSLGSHFAHGDYQRAIGFANALSQANIREEANAGTEDCGRVVPLLEDETLELAGPPWAKEGIVKHKHHLETLEKKAKERGWSECFAVIEKGFMRLFSFNANAKHARHKPKRPVTSSSAGNVVGGGNWTENAEEVVSFLLRQTIASTLPPPGYSKSRPHVWALSLPTGAVHLFHVGTPEIAKEFVSTANYWSARLSKEPLGGGVSNIEYGWGDAVVSAAAGQSRPGSRPESAHPPMTAGSTGGHSLHSHHSDRVATSRLTGTTPMSPLSRGSDSRRSDDHGPGTFRARLPGDRVTISDWMPPQQSMMASNLMEVDQLRALTAYVTNVEEDLRRHNELRPLMGMAFSPRHPNAAKAMANWEKKSAYLLREIVKFRTYIDSLMAAQQAKDKMCREREARNSVSVAADGSNATNEAAGEASAIKSNSAQASYTSTLRLVADPAEQLVLSKLISASSADESVAGNVTGSEDVDDAGGVSLANTTAAPVTATVSATSAGD